MDEIVERVRSRGGDRSPLIPRARRCARARPAEGRWAERMDGLICLQRETDRFAEEWERTREPGAEGRSALIAIETLRTLALSTMADLSQRTEPVPTEDLARLALALHRIESADRLRIEREQAMADAAAHAGAGRARGQYDACRTGRNRPPGSRGARLPWAHRAATAGIGVGRRPLPRTLPSPRRSRRPIRLPPPLPRIHGHPAGAGARCAAPLTTPAEAPPMMWGTRAGRAIMGRAQGAGCRAETAGGGEAALADRPSLLPLGVERTGVRRGAPPPLQPNTRCRRHDHAMWSDRKDTPTSPQPSPPLIHFPQAPGARSASLAFAPCGARGRRGRTGGAVYVPSPPFRGERDRERWVCCLRGAVPQNPTYPTYPT